MIWGNIWRGWIDGTGCDVDGVMTGEAGGSDRDGGDEISPFMPSSCRFIPSCSEYSMQAYKKYGVLKGTMLTAWRLLRCNPLRNQCN
ncbi:hypothetical protein L7F22_061994 [Adiantum nelumboides]|nr:hypothetical protein [Adiantum nelumboides]